MPGIRLYVVCCALVATGCGDDGGSTNLVCGDGTNGALAVGSKVEVTSGAGKDLKGAAIEAEAKTTAPTGEISITCAEDIVPDGFIALGPAVTFGTEGTWSDRPFVFTLPFKSKRLPEGATRRHVRIIAKRAGQAAPFFPPVSNKVVDDKDAYASRVSFRGGELTTYQAVADATAGQSEQQQFAWRAVIGISMGGFASARIAMRHPDRFDAIANIGGDPGPSMVYVLGMINDFLFGGFCTKADEAAGKGMVGQLCPRMSTKKDQFEITADFEHMIAQPGDGVGLTLKRSLYMKASRDLSRSLSNPALYNLENPYTPPGVPLSWISQTAASRCSTPLVLTNFHDREFNPDGTKPVITFCDGNDGPTLGNAVFDPSIPANDPAEVMLAVDLNNNGKRDSGEPVVTNAFEPFGDVGTDGKADKDEPGYNAATNPDPNKDNWHYLRNPLGTELNADFDAGEPYEDVGLDGVAATCQMAAGVSGCYDFGEGNGTWDLSPNVKRWYESDFLKNFEKLTPAQRRHMSVWFDAGIRDFLNNSLAVNTTVGGLMAKYNQAFGVYDGYAVLHGAATEAVYDFTLVDWDDLPQHGYARYGNPDATASQIMGGDGRHVGTAVQVINRATTAFAWLDKRWPDGDRDDTLDGGEIIKDQTFMSSNGRVTPFGLFLPPGYKLPENAGKRYPVVYFSHGYGMEPKDLADLSAVFANYMTAEQPLEYRFQKFIIVYVDGRCRPQVDGVPVDPTGDGCEGGTFYTNAPLGTKAQMETAFLELTEYIDRTYRTKQPSAAEVTP
ncbi:MAG: hypothetical protein H0T46_29550 [Deltaproteobacteria bacterium]|nr:hypothetical protein [Deltaproteobacteria bacterium]